MIRLGRRDRGEDSEELARPPEDLKDDEGVEPARHDSRKSPPEDIKDKGVKIGHTTSAAGRVSNYVDEFGKKVKQKISDRRAKAPSDDDDAEDDLELSVLINIDRLLPESQQAISEFLLDKLESLTFDKCPATLGEAIKHDENGLPFCAQVLIFSLFAA